jgi:hypothetical protein
VQRGCVPAQRPCAPLSGVDREIVRSATSGPDFEKGRLLKHLHARGVHLLTS